MLDFLSLEKKRQLFSIPRTSFALWRQQGSRLIVLFSFCSRWWPESVNWHELRKVERSLLGTSRWSPYSRFNACMRMMRLCAVHFLYAIPAALVGWQYSSHSFYACKTFQKERYLFASSASFLNGTRILFIQVATIFLTVLPSEGTFHFL